jgi:carbonic anhydrase
MSAIPEGFVSAQEAYRRLCEGNRRFVNDIRSLDALQNGARRIKFAQDQRPFAIVLGCSDARVPAELVFDQGLGDLFVIRVAGNIVAPSQIGSIEFGAERFGTRLVVVLGHTRCGAVQAAIDAVQGPGAPRSRNLLSIVDRVRPSVEQIVRVGGSGTFDLYRECVRNNVRTSVAHLRQGSPILEELILREGLVIIGAEYDIETGEVAFIEGVPREWQE